VKIWFSKFVISNSNLYRYSPEIIDKALEKLKVFGMHEESSFFDAAHDIHAQLAVAAALRSAIISKHPKAEDIEKWVADAQNIDAVSNASRGVPVGAVRFDTSLADIPKVGGCTAMEFS
jgi:hypothetical protein